MDNGKFTDLLIAHERGSGVGYPESCTESIYRVETRHRDEWSIQHAEVWGGGKKTGDQRYACHPKTYYADSALFLEQEEL